VASGYSYQSLAKFRFGVSLVPKSVAEPKKIQVSFGNDTVAFAVRLALVVVQLAHCGYTGKPHQQIWLHI
jgi:hypothetical protein